MLSEDDQMEGQMPTGQDEDDKAMDEGTLISILKNELLNAVGVEGSALAQARMNALNYYFNRPRGDEVTGRSKVQSSDVMDVIEWILPDIIEAFTTNEDAVQFQPMGKYDVDQARLRADT